MNQLRKEISWGIIGCGDVTELKSGPAFNKIEGSKLVGVMRRNATKVKDYARRHQVPFCTTNADELINNPDINAIYVATPPGTHADYAIKAMKAGKPVYVEKPMATTAKECQQMVALSKRTHMPLLVAYYRRTLPGFVQVKNWINSSEIGTILFTSIKLVRPALDAEKSPNTFWRVQAEHSGGGIFYDLASHQLDYLDFLFGPISKVKGNVANRGGLYQVEDTVSASFQFANGILGNGIWSFVSSKDTWDDVLEIVGTKGRIEISCFNHSPVILYKDGEMKEYSFTNPENIQLHLIQQVVETLQGNGSCVSTGESALRTNQVMEQIIGNYYK